MFQRLGGLTPIFRGRKTIVSSTKQTFSNQCVTRPKVFIVNRSKGLTPYSTALKWMNELVAGKSDKYKPVPHCVLFIVQHPPVYTLGKAATTENVKFDTSPETCPFELHRLDRGGQVTYHGPGQLTIYPILNLVNFKKDLHWYVTSLENTVSKVLRKYNIDCKADLINPGVWVGDYKVAAIGIKVSRWITMHGVGLNVMDESITGFTRIVPCGIHDKHVTSIETLSQDKYHVSMEQVADQFIEAFSEEFGAEVSLNIIPETEEYHNAPYVSHDYDFKSDHINPVI